MVKNFFRKIDLATENASVVSLTDNHNMGEEWQCEKLNKTFKNIATFEIIRKEPTLPIEWGEK